MLKELLNPENWKFADMPMVMERVEVRKALPSETESSVYLWRNISVYSIHVDPHSCDVDPPLSEKNKLKNFH